MRDWRIPVFLLLAAACSSDPASPGNSPDVPTNLLSTTLNRAVALAMAFGPAVGLELIDAILPSPLLSGYHLLPSVRGDLLAKLGRFEEARAELERAAKLTQNDRERALLVERARACRPKE